MLWQQASSLGVTPANLLGLTAGSYEAYCFNQAVWYLGITITHELEKAGHKPSKEERKTQAVRDRVIKKYFGDEKKDPNAKGQFADPALLFQ